MVLMGFAFLLEGRGVAAGSCLYWMWERCYWGLFVLEVVVMLLGFVFVGSGGHAAGACLYFKWESIYLGFFVLEVGFILVGLVCIGIGVYVSRACFF